MSRSAAKRRRPSAATTIAFVALALAAGGADAIASAARSLIDGKRIKAGTVGSKQGRNGALQTVDLSRKTRAELRGQTGPAGPAGKNGTPGATGAQGPAGIVGEAGGDLTGPFSNLQIAPNAVTGAEIDESTLNDGEVVFADYDAAGSQPLIDFGFGTLVGECTANAASRGFKLTVTGPATSFSQVVLTGRATGETPMGGGPANVPARCSVHRLRGERQRQPAVERDDLRTRRGGQRRASGRDPRQRLHQGRRRQRLPHLVARAALTLKRSGRFGPRLRRPAPLTRGALSHRSPWKLSPRCPERCARRRTAPAARTNDAPPQPR